MLPRLLVLLLLVLPSILALAIGDSPSNHPHAVVPNDDALDLPSVLAAFQSILNSDLDLVDPPVDPLSHLHGHDQPSTGEQLASEREQLSKWGEQDEQNLASSKFGIDPCAPASCKATFTSYGPAVSVPCSAASGRVTGQLPLSFPGNYELCRTFDFAPAHFCTVTTDILFVPMLDARGQAIGFPLGGFFHACPCLAFVFFSRCKP